MAWDSWKRGDADAVGRDFGWSDFYKMSQEDEWSGGYGGAGWGDWGAKYQKETGNTWASLGGGTTPPPTTTPDPNVPPPTTTPDPNVPPPTGDPNAPPPGGPEDVQLPNIDSEGASDAVGGIYDDTSQGILDRNREEREKGGIGYRDPGSQIEQAGIGNKEGRSYLSAEDSVAGQMDKLLNSDSPYIQRARASADEVSQSRGMLSSSMAAGAAEGAAIDRALPIAQQDSDSLTKAALAQQQGDINQAQAQIEGFVTGAIQDQKYELIDRSQALGKAFDSMIAGAEGEAAIALQELKSKWDFALADSIKRLEFNLQKDLDDSNMDKQVAENVRAQAVDLIKNNQIAIENLMKDPDMLNLGPEAMNNAINNMINMTTSSVQLTYDLAGLNLDGYISDMLVAYEETVSFSGGSWEAGGATGGGNNGDGGSGGGGGGNSGGTDSYGLPYAKALPTAAGPNGGAMGWEDLNREALKAWEDSGYDSDVFYAADPGGNTGYASWQNAIWGYAQYYPSGTWGDPQ